MSEHERASISATRSVEQPTTNGLDTARRTGPPCCSPAAQRRCCEPADKAACCGAAQGASTCGCRP